MAEQNNHYIKKLPTFFKLQFNKTEMGRDQDEKSLNTSKSSYKYLPQRDKFRENNKIKIFMNKEK